MPGWAGRISPASAWIAQKPHPDYDLAAWVLGKFPPEDAKAISDRYPDLEAAAELIMDGKLSLAQSKYNG